MNVYHLSMGFVWPTTGSYKGWGGQLLNGAVLANPGTTPTISNFNNLGASDQIQFWIYDLTNSGAQPSVTATFSNGDSWTLIQPVAGQADTVLFANQTTDDPGLTTNIGLTGYQNYDSVYFDANGYPGPHPAWTLVWPSQGSIQAIGVVDPNDTDDPGTFNVQLQVSVSLNGTTVIYGIDPQMVVEPT